MRKGRLLETHYIDNKYSSNLISMVVEGLSKLSAIQFKVLLKQIKNNLKTENILTLQEKFSFTTEGLINNYRILHNKRTPLMSAPSSLFKTANYRKIKEKSEVFKEINAK